MNDTIQSLREQLAKAEGNLRLIQEHEAEYVESEKMPLQLIKNERRLEAQIADLRARLEQRQRIADGLKVQRRQMAESRTQRRGEGRLRVVGQRPLDVTDYFKNRKREMASIGRLLAEPTTRLVSVIGHGGMGKTALACKVLRDLERHRWPRTGDDVPLDGIVYLSTRTAGISLERLFLDCAKVLGGEQETRLNTIWTNPQIGNEDKVSHLLKALSDGRYVILLDNIEDLLDDSGRLVDADLRLFFDHSLTTSHGARLLVTSRVALAFRREVMRFDRQVKLLKGLPIPDGVALLRELDPNGDYGLRDAPKQQLAQAVSLVYGVPRALEVLAGILANDPFASLADVLEQFYEQEDVIQALIEENYKRLDRDARRVIEALAVSRRPAPVLAVDYLLEPFAPGLDVPGIVRRLTRTNIVSIDRAAKTVTLHPIDQDYAYSQLPEDGSGEPAYTRQALERRAADYYVQLRTPSETWKCIDDLEPQLAEFEHRVRAGDYDGACRVLEPIDYDYLYLWGHYTRLVEMREKLLGHLMDRSLQAANLSSMGNAYHHLAQFERAISLFEESLTIAREISDRQREGKILSNLGRTYRVLGQSEQAISFFKKFLTIARETGDRYEESIQLGHLGLVYRVLGQIEQAIELHEEALTIARETGKRWGELGWLGSLGLVYRALGQIERAIKFHEQAMAIAREIGDRPDEGADLGNSGIAYSALGQVERAINLYKEALTIAHEIGDRRREGIWLDQLGFACSALGQVEQATGFYEEALLIAREIGDRLGESFSLLGLSKALLAVEELTEARQCCTEALALDIPETSYRAALALGIVLLHQRDSTAGRTFADAAARCRAMLDKTAGLYEPRYTLATALVGQAICDPRWAEEGERAELLAPAVAEYRRALKNCAAPGVVQDAIRDLELIRAAGIEGLEPAFELLEGYIGGDEPYRPTCPDLPAPGE